MILAVRSAPYRCTRGEGVTPVIDEVKTVSEAAFYSVGVFAAGFSAWTFRRNSRRERTRWLFDLYQRFYEKPDLQAIWRQVDEEDTSFLSEGGDLGLRASFDALLNLFEFIAILHTRKELRRQEIADLFAYPLAKLGADRRTRAYLLRYHYEHLTALLDELGYADPHAIAK